MKISSTCGALLTFDIIKIQYTLVINGLYCLCLSVKSSILQALIKVNTIIDVTKVRDHCKKDIYIYIYKCTCAKTCECVITLIIQTMEIN